MKTKKFLALVLALVMAFSLVVPASANTSGEIPDQPAKLTHNGTEPHETAKMTVYVTGANQPTSVAAVGAINSHMDATLELNYGTYFFDGTITAYGQTEKKANMTTFTLDGTSNNTGIDFTTNSNGEGNYFPGLLDLVKDTPYYIQFVDAMVTTDGETIGNYTFTKTYTAEEKGITLTAKNMGTASLVDDNWQDLKDEAFDEDSDNYDDSYISLAAGSYIALNTEKLIAAGTLKLDDFSDSDSVEANIKNAKKQLMLATGTDLGYQILLKQGTRFKLGNSYADVNTDLLITMTGNAAFNADGTLLSGIYDNLTDAGKTELAKNMLILFSRIAGSVRNGSQAKPVVITFGRPATEIATSDSMVEGTTTATAAIAEDTTGETTTYKTVVTTTTTSGNESTTTTTKPVDVDTATAAKVADGFAGTGTVATSAEAAVTAYSASNNESATFKAALTSGDTATEANVLKTTAAANAIAKAAAQNSETVSQITKAEVILQTELKKAELKNVDTTNQTATVTYDITPVVQLYGENDVKLGDPVPLDNADINEGESFTFNIPVPAVLSTDYIKVTHKGETSDKDETGIYLPSGAKNEVRYVEVTVSHFSDFELEPITEDSVTFDYAQSLSLNEEIAINLYISSSVPLTDAVAHEYTVQYFKTVNGNESTLKIVPFDELEIRTPGGIKSYYVRLAEFAAKQMTDKVTVRVYHKDTQIGDDREYTIRGYCDSVITKNTNSQLVNLCKAVLDYGTYSQKYFGYREDDLAYNSFYYDIDEVAVHPDYCDTSFSGTGIGRTLSLEYRVTLNFYVLPDKESNVSITVGADSGLEVERVGGTTIANKQYIRYAVTGFAASKLGEKVTVNVGGTDYTWSPLNYAYQNQHNSSNAKLANVVRALYNYYSHAVSYFDNN